MSSATLAGALLSATALIGAGAAHAQEAAATSCWEKDEVEAARLHNFRVMLLVGAIHCRDKVPASLDGYNSFMKNSHSAIVASQTVLRAHFIRAGGVANGSRDYANYETLVGNRHASDVYDVRRCRSIGAYSRLAATAENDDLDELARVASGSMPVTCPIATSLAVAPAPAPARAASTPSVTEATDATRRLIAEQTARPPAISEVDQAGLAQLEEAPPPSPPSVPAPVLAEATTTPPWAAPAKALAAAAKALAAAAEAMKAPAGGTEQQ